MYNDWTPSACKCAVAATGRLWRCTHISINELPAAQAESAAEAESGLQPAHVGEMPLTDVPTNSLVDDKVPLDSQPDVQNTLETEQQHAAVYIPGVNEAPEQSPAEVSELAAATTYKAPHITEQPLHSPGVKEQNAAMSGAHGTRIDKAPGMDHRVGKSVKQVQEQDKSSKSDKGGAKMKGSNRFIPVAHETP